MSKLFSFFRLGLVFLFLMLTAQQAVARSENKMPDDVSEPIVTNVKVGDGDELEIDSEPSVEVRFTLWLCDLTSSDYKGKKVYSTPDGGKPDILNLAPFTTKNATTGLAHGMNGMKVGGKRTLVVPSAHAYLQHGLPGKVPPNSAVVYEVELLRIIPSGGDQ